MLQGTLTDFTLADVFSLLALTKKTGALTVTSGGTDGRVFFRDGVICLALSDAKRVPLGARLVNAGLVDHEQVRSTVEQHAGDSVAVTEALLASGQVEDRLLGVFLREQIVDAVFELMRLEEGSFSFDAGTPALSRGVGLSMVEVVGEANRRLDEWQAIHKRISSPHSVLAMVPTAAGGKDGVTLSPEQWEMLALVDGRRTVADVVELTGRGEFATCRVLGDLVSAGLIQAKDTSVGEETDLARLIAGREALRALENVGRGGINPGLSSASALNGGAQTRWVEPAPAPATAAPDRPARMLSRTRTPEAPSGAAEPVSDEPAPTPATPAVENSDEAREEAGADLTEEVAAGEADPHLEAGGPAPEPTAETASPQPVGSASVDRAQVARELASLGLDDPIGSGGRGAPALTRDDDVNKGLLVRLIDGVKGA